MAEFRYERRRRGGGHSRSTFGYWVPLVVTLTVATIGVAAWVWKERNDNDDDGEEQYGGRPGGKRGGKPGGDNSPGVSGPAQYGDIGPGAYPQQGGTVMEGPPQQGPTGLGTLGAEDPSMLARMSGALRRTPSPQQIWSGASKQMAAGVAAAGAVVGGALSSIREEGANREDVNYEDHSRWAQEAESRRVRDAIGQPATAPTAIGIDAPNRPGQKSARKKTTVAIVISADTEEHEMGDAQYHSEFASILSHLPEHIDADSRVFVMIYAPNLKTHPLASSTTRTAPSIASSFSNIGHEDLHTPNEEAEKSLSALDPRPAPSPSPEGSSETFRALYQQARVLVEQETMIMPFTTPSGYVQLLKQIAPDAVYVQATLAGLGGRVVKQVVNTKWVGQVVLVVGDETGHGGLVDSEDERPGRLDREEDLWWQEDGSVGLGKGIEVVEGLRIGEDWKRRIRGHD